MRRTFLAITLALVLSLTAFSPSAGAEPSPEWSTYMGTNGMDWPGGVATDSTGASYATWSTFWHSTGQWGLVVLKLSPSGEVVWSYNFFSSQTLRAADIAVANGVVVVSGDTDGTIGASPNAWQRTNRGEGDAFVLKLDTSGRFQWLSYVGGSGSDFATDVDLDNAGVVAVAGYTSSCDFPIYGQAFQRTSRSCGSGHGFEGFVTKLTADGSSAVYSTYLGGSSIELIQSVAMSRSSGSLLVTGFTASADFPTTSGAFDRTHNGGFDMFVTKIDGVGSGLIFSTYLGSGGDDFAWGVARDASSNVYVAGYTDGAGMPTTAKAHQTAYAGGDCTIDMGPGGIEERTCWDMYVAKLNSAGSGLAYGTYIGGAGEDLAREIAVDASGAAFVIGESDSEDFPWMDGPAAGEGSFNPLALALTPSGNAVMYARTLTGNSTEVNFAEAVAALPDGRTYHFLGTFDPDLATTEGAWRPDPEDGDGYLVKLGAPTGTLVFKPLPGNEWWAELALGGREANLVAKVEARDSDSDYATLTHQAWGKWGGVVHVEPGHETQYRVTLTNGVVRLHCPASGCFVDPTPAFDATFTGVKGNEWWIQASVSASGGSLAKVEVSLNNGSWLPLDNKGWGWAKSYRAPQGTMVQFRATSATGATDLSGCYRWTAATPVACGAGGDGGGGGGTDPTFQATFSNVRGNEWWVETDVSVTGGTLAGVDARVNGGAWTALTKQSWGSWAKSIRAPAGSQVEFRATSTTGATSMSSSYTWPPG